MTGAYVFEAQIRDKLDHASNTMDSDVDVTVLEDTLHDRARTLTAFDRVRVYVEDDHDRPLTIDLETAPAADADYSGAVVHDTLSSPAGAFTSSAAYTGPLGKFRFATSFGGASTDTAPADGSIRVSVYGWP